VLKLTEEVSALYKKISPEINNKYVHSSCDVTMNVIVSTGALIPEVK
jgi:hypothetical protein